MWKEAVLTSLQAFALQRCRELNQAQREQIKGKIPISVERALTVKAAKNGHSWLLISERFKVMACCPLAGLQRIPAWMGWTFPTPRLHRPTRDSLMLPKLDVCLPQVKLLPQASLALLPLSVTPIKPSVPPLPFLADFTVLCAPLPSSHPALICSVSLQLPN